MSKLQKGDKKLLNAWAFYDWANSVYALVISSSIFPLFFGVLFRAKNAETITFLGSQKSAETIISYITAFGFLIIAFISPLLSGIADYLGNKKFFMKLFCFVGAISCMMLYFFNLENLYFGLTCYTLALIGFWGSLVFYNSYLPDIAFPDQQDAISAKGFSMGYIGSVVLLVINLAMVMTVPDEMKLQMMRYSFVLVGLWWLGFSQYSYLHLPNNLTGKPFKTDVIFNGFKELKKVWQMLQTLPSLKKYLTAFFVYSMAVQTIMIIAAYFGEKEVNWGSDKNRTMGLIVSILLIQVIAVGGAFLTNKLAKKIGNIKSLMFLNIAWVFICILAYFVKQPNEFYAVAALVGLVMGGIQSLSRSTYSKFIPETVTDTTSFFSFYDVAEKIGIVIGMTSFGYISDKSTTQNAILFLIIFFVTGAILLFRMRNVEK